MLSQAPEGCNLARGQGPKDIPLMAPVLYATVRPCRLEANKHIPEMKAIP